MNDITKQLAEALSWIVEKHEEGQFIKGKCIDDARAALAAYHSQQSFPCDMGEICIGCEPRWDDGGCPGEKAQAAPEGWRLVPEEPTEQMMGAAWDHTPLDMDDMTDGDFGQAYKDMLAAAPQLPQQEERKPLDVERLIDELSEWDRYVIEDRSHDRLEVHIRRVLFAHGIK